MGGMQVNPSASLRSVLRYGQRGKLPATTKVKKAAQINAENDGGYLKEKDLPLIIGTASL